MARTSAHLLRLGALADLVAEELSPQLDRAAELAVDALEGGGKLLFCGNGGSAADAQHLATEYIVRFRRGGRPLPALALTTDTSLLTAAANDLGFERVFARQVEALGVPGDLLFLHSTTGKSPNLLAAARAAGDNGMRTVAALAAGGGALAAMVDLALIVPTDDGAHAQELHLAMGHAICGVVEEILRGGG